MGSRTPSNEQKSAIEHSGGVWLSAGAGAGKTFVLVEHIYFLVREFLNKNKDVTAGELKEYLSGIVLMTFTKKAAGELEIRILDKINELPVEHDLYPHLGLLRDSMGALNITTIHGFCYLLIQKGFVPYVDSSKGIATNLEYQDKINLLVNEWFEEHLGQDRVNTEVIMNQKRIKEAFQQVFNSPELRRMWRQMERDENYLATVTSELFELLNMDRMVNFQPVGKTPPKLQKLMEYFNGLEPECLEDLLEIDDFFKTFGNLPSSKEIDDFKALKEFLKKNRENIEVFLNEKEIFQKWSEEINSIFDFVEDKFVTFGNLNFSDLEYYTNEALDNPEIAKSVLEEFNYFIIDEFQDTSEIQFDIVNKIIASDLSRLFCVGDIKQAIYGFRGGEIKLIQKLSADIPRNLNLNDNYRSGERIVEFNNDFFESILKKGDGYTGVDRNQVPVNKQNYANKSIEGSRIEKIRIDLVDESRKSLTQGDLEKIEAIQLFNYIERNPGREICILYRKLSPLKYLLPLLLKSELAFSLQLKVETKKDPLWNIFKLLLETSDQGQALIATYFSFLDISTDKLESSIELFQKQKDIIGLWQSFLSFLYRHGIHNSNYENNLSLIQALCLVCGDDAKECYEKINEYEDGSYSIDFRRGTNSGRLKIMTVHASKGLEFEQVILAGVSTNGKSKGFDKIIGGFPLSFKWGHEHKLYKSPSYLLEELHGKRAEFSESKRLFYVACTRAREVLTWFDITLNGVEKSYSANSWINALRIWENESGEISPAEIIEMDGIDGTDSLTAGIPEFHLSPLGITASKKNFISELVLVSELSVTRFSDLAQCPRKFFLNNILKFTPENMEELSPFLPQRQSELPQLPEENGPVVKSSKSRGTEIHFKIEKLIKENTLPENPANQLVFVQELLRPYRGEYDLISEEPVRFSLFGHIINGTPDLVLSSMPQGKVEIWDFKTGEIEENFSYWIQLFSYGFSFWEKTGHENFTLKLVYVDHEKIIERNVSIEEIKKELLECWRKTVDYTQTNTGHCHKCEFQNLCQEV